MDGADEPVEFRMLPFMAICYVCKRPTDAALLYDDDGFHRLTSNGAFRDEGFICAECHEAPPAA